tara:strand:+ start:575 stop:1096 length:522 start_codon:yes stop_codon:yes gene_type:complete
MEDIFDKGEQVVKKPKRKLTDKQKENLRLGRERMAEKRRLAKEKGEVIKSKKQLAEEKKALKKGEKEHTKIKTENRTKKRKTMKEITKEKEDEILLKLREKEKAVAEEEKDNVLENVFHKLKIDCLSKAKNVSEYKTIQHHLDGMTMDILKDDTKLKEFAVNTMEKLRTIQEE